MGYVKPFILLLKISSRIQKRPEHIRKFTGI